MHQSFLAWLTLLPLLVMSATCYADSSQESYLAQVISIADGDTIVVLRQSQQIRVRLAEIDAPEKNQPWSNKSKLALGTKIFGEEVALQVSSKDRYGRSIAWIELDGREINREMVRDGHAWAYRRYLVTQDLLEEETAAKERQVGLWSLAHPIPPWQWRGGQRVRKITPAAKKRNLTCGVKLICSEMQDCAEARFHLTQCGVKSLDGDGDGLPCERLCNAR